MRRAGFCTSISTTTCATSRSPRTPSGCLASGRSSPSPLSATAPSSCCEPLWIEYVVSWLTLATAWRLTRFGRPRSPKVVFFAIENNDPLTVLDRGRTWLRPMARAALWLLRWAIPRLTSRCVFGTQGGADAYAGLTPSPVETKVIWDLPAARDLNGDATVPASPHAAVFVGALEARKGVEPLLAAWSQVEEHAPDAHLTIIGDGPLRETVATWSEAAPDSRAWLGLRDRREVVGVLARSTALVAPSVRSGRWREQVGRPILEALSCGLTVVTTTESGLSGFLRGHGHRVIDTPLTCSELRAALCDALDHPLPRTEVRAALPPESGRITADRWLHRRD